MQPEVMTFYFPTFLSWGFLRHEVTAHKAYRSVHVGLPRWLHSSSWIL